MWVVVVVFWFLGLVAMGTGIGGMVGASPRHHRQRRDSETGAKFFAAGVSLMLVAVIIALVMER